MTYRDRTAPDVIRQFTTKVELMHQEFVEPSKDFADIVIQHGDEIHQAVDRITFDCNDSVISSTVLHTIVEKIDDDWEYFCGQRRAR